MHLIIQINRRHYKYFGIAYYASKQGVLSKIFVVQFYISNSDRNNSMGKADGVFITIWRLLSVERTHPIKS